MWCFKHNSQPQAITLPTPEDAEVEEFQLTKLQTPKDNISVPGNRKADVGEDANTNWDDTNDPYGNTETNRRDLSILVFDPGNNLLLANTPGAHKVSRSWTWHSPGGEHHHLIGWILVKKCFWLNINMNRTRTTSSWCLFVQVWR